MQQRAGIATRLIRLRDGLEVLEYLTGTGIYHDRAQFPEPSLLVLDLKMPGKSGLEVLQRLRDQKSFEHLPVIIETSSADSNDLEAAGKLGVTAYFVKPGSLCDWTTQAQTSWCR